MLKAVNSIVKSLLSRKIIVWLILFLPYAVHAASIVSLTPNITELVYVAGAGDQLVGVSAHSDYPPAAQSLPTVADATQVDIEKILALHPSVVIAWQEGGAGQWSETFKQFHIPVYWCSIKTLSDIPKAIRNIGQLANTQAIAETYAEQWQQQYTRISQSRTQTARPTVVIQESLQPIYAASGASLQTQIIQLCGGKNPLSDRKGDAVQLDPESILKLNPDVLLVMNTFQKAFWQKWPQLVSVQNHRVYTLNPDWISRPGPRMLKAVKQICQLIH